MTTIPLRSAVQLIDKECGYQERVYDSGNDNHHLQITISSIDSGRVVQLRLFSLHQLFFSYSCQLSCFHWKSNGHLQRLCCNEFERLLPCLLDIFRQSANEPSLAICRLTMLPAGRLQLDVEERQTLGGNRLIFSIPSFRLTSGELIQQHFITQYHLLGEQLTAIYGEQTELIQFLKQHNPALLLVAHRQQYHSKQRRTLSDNQRWTDIYEDLQRPSNIISAESNSTPVDTPLYRQQLFDDLPISPEVERLFGDNNDRQQNTSPTSQQSIVVFSKTLCPYPKCSSGGDELLIQLIATATTNNHNQYYHLDISVTGDQQRPLDRYRTIQAIDASRLSAQFNSIDPTGKTLIPWLTALFDRCIGWQTTSNVTVTNNHTNSVTHKSSAVRLLVQLTGIDQHQQQRANTAPFTTECNRIRLDLVEIGRWHQSTVLDFTVDRLPVWHSLGDLHRNYRQQRQRLLETRMNIDRLLATIRQKNPALLVHLTSRRPYIQYTVDGLPIGTEDQYLIKL